MGMTPAQFIQQYQVHGHLIDGPHSTTDDSGWEHYAMRVRLTYRTPLRRRRSITVPWRMGLGHDMTAFTGDSPTARLPSASTAQVLESLGLDLSVRTMGLEEFIGSFGCESARHWEATRDLARRVYDWCHSEQMADDLVELEEV